MAPEIPETTTPNHHRRALIIGALLFVGLALLALSYLRLQSNRQNVPPQDESAVETSEEVVNSMQEFGEGQVRPDGTTVISGTVVEVLTKQESTDQWITILTVDETGMTHEYKFYVSPDTILSTSIEGGKKVQITFIGELSSTDFVLAKIVADIQQ